MSELIYLEDAYLKRARATVVEHGQGGVILDRTLLYPRGGGQPGDSGRLDWDGGTLAIADTVKSFRGPIQMAAPGGLLPAVGTQVIQTLDWPRRHAHMRVHTALHLLSVVIPLPVTGGAITAEKGRLDFDMEEPLDKDAVEAELNALIARDLPVGETWITDEELAANPGLVKTMSVKPPMGQGRIRLIRIGDGDGQIDLQPCGGTHVRSTREIGRVTIGKVEKKGRRNRRVNVVLAQ